MKHGWLLGLLLMGVSSFAQEAADHKLILIRHAEATNNTENVYNSNPSHKNYKPAPLTERGKLEVKTLAQSLAAQGFDNDNIEAVFVSPLPRAKETADLLAKAGLFAKDKITVDKRLTEWQAGDLEGRTVLAVMSPSMAQQFHAEAQEQVDNRIQDFYRSISKKYPDGNVIAITHAIPAQALITFLTRQVVKLAPGEARVLPLEQSK